MISFNDSSYRTQVRRLKELGIEALKNYPVRVKAVTFVQHGENTTFRVRGNDGKSFLLRVHRSNYHSKPALQEELKFLKYLNGKSNVQVQKPIPNKSMRYITKASNDMVPEPRFCTLLEWQPGSIRYKDLTLKDVYKVGLLTANMHLLSQKVKPIHRKYWTPEGMIGSRAKMGTIIRLKEVIPKHYNIVKLCQQKYLRRLKRYQKRTSNVGMIHADLHFGNIVWHKGLPIPIDFDDCGYGFHAYDTAVTFSALGYSSNQKRPSKKYLEGLEAAYLEGYSSVLSLEDGYLETVKDFMVARRLVLFAWMLERSDNPLLRKRFKEVLPKSIKYFKNHI